jgi:hypothetical protein
MELVLKGVEIRYLARLEVHFWVYRFQTATMITRKSMSTVVHFEMEGRIL